MKLLKPLLVMLVLGVATSAHAALINVDSFGTNITNTVTALVPLVWQGGAFAPSNSNDTTRLDWLNTGGSYDPGQIKGYNDLTSSVFGQAGVNVINDDTASGNASGYSVTAGYTYYFTAHYGGSYVAWALDATDFDPLTKYTVPTSIGGVSGATDYAADHSPVQGNYNANQGLSNVRAWRGSAISTNGPSVPDGGTTLLSLGISLLGLGGFRHFLKAKKA